MQAFLDNYITYSNLGEIAKKYKHVRSTSDWDEQYKWDILSSLNIFLSNKTVTTSNVLEIIKVLKMNL